MPHRVLLADDHEGIRRRVRSALENAGFDVCGEAANGKEAVSQTQGLTPDLIVLNLSMPVMNGLEALPHIAQSVPRAKVVVFTMDDGDELRREVLRRGAHAFVSKSSPLSELVGEIEKLLK
jgi:DNA-binding NarL/FixJ family response regulator